MSSSIPSSPPAPSSPSPAPSEISLLRSEVASLKDIVATFSETLAAKLDGIARQLQSVTSKKNATRATLARLKATVPYDAVLDGEKNPTPNKEPAAKRRKFVVGALELSVGDYVKVKWGTKVYDATIEELVIDKGHYTVMFTAGGQLGMKIKPSQIVSVYGNDGRDQYDYLPVSSVVTTTGNEDGFFAWQLNEFSPHEETTCVAAEMVVEKVVEASSGSSEGEGGMEEKRKVIAEDFPSDWIITRGAKNWEFKLLDGTRIRSISAAKAHLSKLAVIES